MENNKEVSNYEGRPEEKEPDKVILADDDKGDQEIFKDALNETKIPAELTMVNNGRQLIDNLKDPRAQSS